METEIIEGDLVRTGSTNVFADLGLPNPEGRLLKAQLMRAINAEIRRRALTQEATAALVDLKQPELSRIANGRGSGFSTDRLIEVLRHLGRRYRSRRLQREWADRRVALSGTGLATHTSAPTEAIELAYRARYLQRQPRHTAKMHVRASSGLADVAKVGEGTSLQPIPIKRVLGLYSPPFS